MGLASNSNDNRRVIVVGAGLAGLSCALALAQKGVSCALVSMQASERAQSVMAEGGINAALDIMGEGDSVEQHFEDTMRGGVWLADPNAVRALAEGAPEVVREFIALGVPFQCEGSKMVQRNFGGQKKKRTAFAKSSTGKVLVTSLIDAVRRYEAAGLVERFSHHEVAEIACVDATCAGVIVRDLYTGGLFALGGPVVLASGGYAGLFGARTTGTTQNVGDVTALALRCGAALGNLEFVQYHPTTVPITGKRMLVSEAARGEGGRLAAERGGVLWYFMEERYPEYGNLMPRDVVSREEALVMRDPACTGQVWLDMRHLDRRVWAERLSDLREECVHYLSIDPARELLPVEPGIHYCMGGIYVDEAHRSSVEGLYAAGECACQYHGANRLGGNSLLGAVFGGKVAARSAMQDGCLCAEMPGDAAGGALEDARKTREADAPFETELHGHLDKALGIRRDGIELASALAFFESLDLSALSRRSANRCLLARAVTASALAREESRGAHFRVDFPKSDEKFRKTTVVQWSDSQLNVDYRDIAQDRTAGRDGDR